MPVRTVSGGTPQHSATVRSMSRYGWSALVAGHRPAFGAAQQHARVLARTVVVVAHGALDPAARRPGSRVLRLVICTRAARTRDRAGRQPAPRAPGSRVRRGRGRQLSLVAAERVGMAAQTSGSGWNGGAGGRRSPFGSEPGGRCPQRRPDGLRGGATPRCPREPRPLRLAGACGSRAGLDGSGQA